MEQMNINNSLINASKSKTPTTTKKKS